MTRKALTAAESFRLAAGLGGEPGRLLGLDSAKFVELVGAVIELDLTDEVELLDESDIVHGVWRLLRRVPVKSQPRLLAALIDHAEQKARLGGLELDEGFVNDIKSIHDNLVASCKPTEVDLVGGVRALAGLDEDGFLEQGGARLHTRSFYELVTDAHEYYAVPMYQRRYSWSHEQFHQLWEDLVWMRQSRQRHFMGYMTMQVRGHDSIPEIIDGQQRFATLLIMARAAGRRLGQLAAEGSEPEINKKRQVTLHEIVMRKGKPHKRAGQSTMLWMGSLDALQYELMMVAEDTTIMENKSLYEAWEYFSDKFADLVEGEEVVDFVLDAFKGTYAVVVELEGQRSAHAIFETLNNRGRQTSSLDIVKNVLVEEIATSDRFSVNRAADIWDLHMLGLGDKVDGDKFMRELLLMQEKTDAFPTTRFGMNEARRCGFDGRGLLQSMGKHRGLFQAMSGDYEFYWQNRTAVSHEVPNQTETLEILGATDMLGLAFAAYDRLTEREFAELMRLLVSVTVRHWVVWKRANEALECLAATITSRLRKEEIGLEEISRMLVRGSPSDLEFKSHFEFLSIPTRGSASVAAYFMCALEQQARTGEMPAELTTIEHVLPINPGQEWKQEFNTDTWPAYIDRLGNFALLELQAHRELADPGKDIKFEVLRDSPYAINHMIASAERWNADAVWRHQRHLANLATAVWQLPKVA